MIRNRIAEVRAPNRREIVEPVQHIVIHRTGLSVREPHNPAPVEDADLNAVLMADRFCRGLMGSYTGNAFPYHFVVRRDGVAEQAFPLDIAGAHARGFNGNTLAIAYVGEHDCNSRQREAIEQVATALCLYSRIFSIVGHTDLPGASADPSKVCPHADFPMAEVRRGVASRLPERWEAMPRQRVEMILRAEGYQLSRKGDKDGQA